MASLHAEAVQRPAGAFQHVLVCLDRSEASASALPLSVHLAAIDRARVTLLHVLEAPPRSGEKSATDALGWEIAREEAGAFLKRMAERVRLPTETHVAEGVTAGQIVSLARELKVDLVALATHGEGGAGEWSLGGTAEKVLASTHASILVTPAGHESGAAHAPPRRILVPLDGSRRTESILPTAVRLARGSDAEVILAHAVWEPVATEILCAPEDLALARGLAERQASSAARYLERLRGLLEADGVRTRALVRRGHDHREVLVSLATAEEADLILLCAHGSVCNALRPYGTVAGYLIAHSTAPLLVIQDLPERARRSTPAPPGPATRTPIPPRSLDAEWRS